jgi:hypothetical protein
MGKFNADMGLDWSGVCVQTSNNRAINSRPCKPFLCLYSISSITQSNLQCIFHCKIKEIHAYCVQIKNNEEINILYAFILGLLAWMCTPNLYRFYPILQSIPALVNLGSLFVSAYDHMLPPLF